MSATNVKFSVVIPAFNSGMTIKRAVDSVLRQTYPSYELIIVNDASSDDTVQVVEQFVREKPPVNVRLISLEYNQGPSHARNIGWNLATGDYVAFLDSDDEWLPDKLLIQSRYLHQIPDIVLIGQIYPSLNRSKKPIFKVGKCLILVRNYFWTSTVAVKKCVPERFDESLRRCEDHLLFCMLTLSYDRSYYFSDRLVIIEYKAPIGESGLSKSIVRMQIGNWHLYWVLLRKHYINAFSFCVLEIISTLKFILRPVRIMAWKLGWRI